MGKFDNAKTSLEAVELGIKSFGEYSEQLSEFNKETYDVLQELGETHQDQNYENFCNFFEPVWKKMDSFIKEVDEFRNYLNQEKEILVEYIDTGNKPILK